MTQRTPLDGTKTDTQIKKVSYTHDAMIDTIIANPGISEEELAEMVGYSKVWVSRLICSDAFQQRLSQRKGELIDPVLTATVEERLRGVTMKAITVVEEKLEATSDAKLAMQFLNLSVGAKSYGARGGQPVPVQNNFVVALPTRSASAEEWSKAVEGEVIKKGAE